MSSIDENKGWTKPPAQKRGNIASSHQSIQNDVTCNNVDAIQLGRIKRTQRIQGASANVEDTLKSFVITERTATQEDGTEPDKPLSKRTLTAAVQGSGILLGKGNGNAAVSNLIRLILPNAITNLQMNNVQDRNTITVYGSHPTKVNMQQEPKPAKVNTKVGEASVKKIAVEVNVVNTIRIGYPLTIEALPISA